MSQNHQKIEYRKIRNVVVWLYDSTCYQCNLKTDKIEVHHDDRNSLNNSITNLVPLCKNCHTIIGKSNYQFKISKAIINKKLLFKAKQFV